MNHIKEVATRLRGLRDALDLSVEQIAADCAFDAIKTAKRLSDCGVKGIVNFTNALINLKDKVRVENISVIDALQKVSAKI